MVGGRRGVWGCERGGDGRTAAAFFAAHGGILFLFPFPSPIFALHEADRLDQREGEGEGEADRESERVAETERVSARACARAAFEALVICAHRTTVRQKVGRGEGVYWALVLHSPPPPTRTAL